MAVSVAALLMVYLLAQEFKRGSESLAANRKGLCASNMKQIGLRLQLYAQDHDGHFPPAARWIAETLPYLKHQEVYHCPSAAARGPDYALNVNLGSMFTEEMKSSAPSPVVFDTRRGSIVATGPEAGDARHLSGLNVLTTDGDVRWVKDLKGLNWVPPGVPASRHERSHHN